MRVATGKLLAAALLTLCVGVQALEATGRWDRTFDDTGDEAVVVVVVLCIGAAIAVARATSLHAPLPAVESPVAAVRSVTMSPARRATSCTFSNSPPLSLRL